MRLRFRNGDGSIDVECRGERPHGIFDKIISCAALVMVFVIAFLVQKVVKLFLGVCAFELDIGELYKNHCCAEVAKNEFFVRDGHPLYFGKGEFRYPVFQSFFGGGFCQEFLINCIRIEFCQELNVRIAAIFGGACVDSRRISCFIGVSVISERIFLQNISIYSFEHMKTLVAYKTSFE